MHPLQLRASIHRAFHVQCVGNVLTLKPLLKVYWGWSSGFTIFWFCQCSSWTFSNIGPRFNFKTPLLMISFLVSSLKFTFTVLAYMNRVLRASDCLPGKDSIAWKALLLLLVLRRSHFFHNFVIFMDFTIMFMMKVLSVNPLVISSSEWLSALSTRELAVSIRVNIAPLQMLWFWCWFSLISSSWDIRAVKMKEVISYIAIISGSLDSCDI